jgi:outer membrane protein
MMFTSLFWGVATIVATVTVASAEMKIGYVDSERVSADYKAYAEAREKAEQLSKDYQQQAMTKQNELSKMVEDYKRQELLLSPERKAEMQAMLSKKDEEFQMFTEEVFGQTGKLAQKQMELVKPIIDKVMATIQKVAEAEDYDFVFDKASLPFAKLKYDLTDKVLAELNKPTTK